MGRSSLWLPQFSPPEGRVVFFLGLSQVFGSKSASLNFSRYTALICNVSAVLFRLPLTHCVDDVICVEPSIYAVAGKRCFDVLVRLCGWKMSEDKNVEPCDSFAVIGVQLDLKPFPTSWPLLSITKKRVQSLVQLLSQILADENLGCARLRLWQENWAFLCRPLLASLGGVG